MSFINPRIQNTPPHSPGRTPSFHYIAAPNSISSISILFYHIYYNRTSKESTVLSNVCSFCTSKNRFLFRGTCLKSLSHKSYAKIGFIAAAKASFCACASAKSFPNVVKYVLIFGSVPDGRTIASAPPSSL